jgi:hypothetical protein
MRSRSQPRRIRASARVLAEPDAFRASDLLIAMLATLGGVAGLLYFIAMLFPELAA